MKILTYNAWHGLNGRGTLAHGELESKERRSTRLARQMRQLRELKPDIAFLQEVNPLAKRLRELTAGLSMNGVAQSDLCGIKIWGKGIPGNLSSGLAILATAELTKLRGLRLSGSRWTFATLNFSFQTAETRYAILAELRTRDWGRLLVVNAHLHHGFEPSESLLQELQLLANQRVITEAQCTQIVREMEHTRARRLGEGQRLLDEITKVRSGYDGVILAGDMNADPDAAVVGLIQSFDLVDVTPRNVHTWHKERNTYNFELSETFALPVSDFGIPALHHLLHEHENRPTRLDYIFVSPDLASRVGTVTLFGHDLPVDEITSDHFGIVAELH